jgi:hypothetical protein
MERLRVQWADVLAGVSACRELQVLVLPYITAKPSFPLEHAVSLLNHLEISDYDEQERPPDAGVVGLWELMASGGLPALAKLSVSLEGRAWGDMEAVRTRVVPAFEAVAGTLSQLHLRHDAHSGPGGKEVEVGYELGVAVGKLRRLKDLRLDLSRDGRAYHAFAQGLAASGGERPLPLLWRVGVVSGVTTNADLLVSLLLPSVGVFISRPTFNERDIISRPTSNDREALLTACALRQAGFKHTWAVECPWEVEDAAGAIAQCSLGDVLLHCRSWDAGRLA